MKLGDEIRRGREAKGLSQSALAREAGMTQQRVSELERDAECGTRTLEKLIEAGILRWTNKGPRAAV